MTEKLEIAFSKIKRSKWKNRNMVEGIQALAQVFQNTGIKQSVSLRRENEQADTVWFFTLHTL